MKFFAFLAQYFGKQLMNTVCLLKIPHNGISDKLNSLPIVFRITIFYLKFSPVEQRASSTIQLDSIALFGLGIATRCQLVLHNYFIAVNPLMPMKPIIHFPDQKNSSFHYSNLQHIFFLTHIYKYFKK